MRRCHAARTRAMCGSSSGEDSPDDSLASEATCPLAASTYHRTVDLPLSVLPSAPYPRLWQWRYEKPDAISCHRQWCVFVDV